jgi:hypothetical protein
MFWRKLFLFEKRLLKFYVYTGEGYPLIPEQSFPPVPGVIAVMQRAKIVTALRDQRYRIG